MSQSALGKVVGDALLVFLNAQASVTGLGVTARWSKSAQNEPVYPADAVADCPNLRLREYIESAGPGMNGGSSSQGHPGSQTPPIRMSLWYQERQVPGQEHHQLLIAHMETIVNVFLGNWQPLQVLNAVNGAGATLYGVYTDKPVVHDDLEHEFGEPRLRISVGEIPLNIQIATRG